MDYLNKYIACLGKKDPHSQKELANFLVLDYFAVDASYASRGVESIKEETRVAYERLTRKYSAYKYLLYVFDMVVGKLFVKGFSSSEKKVLFQNAKYPRLILQFQKKYRTELIAQGKKDRFFAVKNGMGWVATDDFYQYVYGYLQNQDFTYLEKLLSGMEEKLNIAKPDYIVLWDDGLPLGRAIVLVAKKLGIKTFVIQHGVYDAASFFPYHAVVANYFLLWGQYFKDVFLSNKVRGEEDMYVLGYPRHIEEDEKGVVLRRKRICFLGQDYERLYPHFLPIKLETLEAISRTCKQLGLEFVYRPHPGDDRNMLKAKLPDIVFTQKGETLGETFQTSDIFISVSSSALVEAAMRSKISLQLLNYPITLDNFEALGICTKTFRTSQELGQYLGVLADSKDLKAFQSSFNNAYIETRGDLASRFFEIIEGIEKKNRERKN